MIETYLWFQAGVEESSRVRKRNLYWMTYEDEKWNTEQHIYNLHEKVVNQNEKE